MPDNALIYILPAVLLALFLFGRWYDRRNGRGRSVSGRRSERKIGAAERDALIQQQRNTGPNGPAGGGLGSMGSGGF